MFKIKNNFTPIRSVDTTIDYLLTRNRGRQVHVRQRTHKPQLPELRGLTAAILNRKHVQFILSLPLITLNCSYTVCRAATRDD